MSIRREISRLILWDIDGTLIHGGPVAAEAFGEAVAAVSGRDATHHGVSMGGKTDPQIALEIMERVGVPEGEAYRSLAAVLRELERLLEAGVGRLRSEGWVHPGVIEILERLDEREDVLQSVLTGNLAANAKVKLSAFGLDRFLDLEVAAYGSDHRDRDELLPISLRRVHERHGVSLQPQQACVIGDTARDLACARAGGARCLLVATGRVPFEEMLELGADAVLPDLSNVQHVVELLLGTMSPVEIRLAR